MKKGPQSSSEEKRKRLKNLLLALRERKRLEPVSFGQQRLWFLDQMEGANATYNMRFGLELRGNFAVVLLERALTLVVERHESLRTRFRSGEEEQGRNRGYPMQEIAAAESCHLEVVDLVGTGETEREQLFEALVNREAHRPFMLAVQPLWRARLYLLEPPRLVFQLTVHHIISDGWSMGLLVREAIAFYTDLLTGKKPAPIPLPWQYSDFAKWQRERLSGPLLEKQLFFWKEQLADLPPLLTLPSDHPRPEQLTYRGRKLYFELTQKGYEPLKILARTCRATMFMTLISGFAAFLSRYSGQADLVLGTPIANRARKEIQPLIGLFVNTLIMRFKCLGTLTFEGLIRQVKATAIQAFRHGDLPFETLVKALKPERFRDRHPLFQALFVLQNGADERLDIPAVESRILPLEGQVAKFDLHLGLTDSGEGLKGYVEYSTDLFEESTIRRWMDGFRFFLEHWVNDPLSALDKVPLLDGDQKRRILLGWNETRRSWPGSVSLHRDFEVQAAAHPDRIAMAAPDGPEPGQFSFAALNRAANEMAQKLLAFGIGSEDAVGLGLAREPRLMIGLLAILKSGAAYVPLDLGLPEERLRFIIEDSGLKVLLHGGNSRLSARPGITALLVDHGLPQHEREAPNPQKGLSPEQSLSLIYTSGSSGRPKGVINVHGAYRNRLQWMLHEFPLNDSSRMLHKTPLSFDVSLWEIFWPLLGGGVLVLARPDGHSDHQYLAETVWRRQITDSHFVPSMLRFFLRADRLGQCSSLRRVFASGEALNLDLVEAFHRKLDAVLVNLYGPTEAAIEVSHFTCPPQISGLAVPIGRPIANAELYVLDEGLQPLPIGVLGQLFIAGRPLARGYVGRPCLTAEAFIPNPFGTEPGTRLYRSGDVVYRRDDGLVVFVGRLDRQVKLRGFRIELGEIEAALKNNGAVREAAAVLRGGKNPFLAAYVVLRENTAADGAGLRENLRGFLPRYTVPSVIVILDALPLLASGKLDHRALPAPEFGKTSARAFVAPKTRTEKKLAAIWRELLELDKIGSLDHFFDLGGHSLLTLRLRDVVKQRLNAELALVDLFRYPTLQSLAEQIDKQLRPENVPLVNGGPAASPPIGAADLTFSQPSLAAAENDIAVIGLACRFPGAENPEAYWENLVQGRSSIRHFTREELVAAGIPARLLDDADYVRSAPVLERLGWFDAEFFGLSSREATFMDLQRRLLLECGQEALEQAGYVPGRWEGRIAAFTGAGVNNYLLYNLLPRAELRNPVDEHALYLQNMPDFASTQLSYLLGLRGPSFTLNSACSTSLVAIHEACKSLRLGEADMALAGGANVSLPEKRGYLYMEDGIRSPDGYCRPFDADASGTVFGSGAGMVVLKRLRDALEAGDHIWAVVRGSAVNNDGARKLGYTAPSIEGQAEVIRMALQRGGVDPASVSYIEAHGTGTRLGDPIEVAALSEAFRGATSAVQHCAIGSVKGNIGHLDTAAGIAGFIKTVLAVSRGVLPASLHCAKPNPAIDWQAGPFFVNRSRRPWTAENGPRRAGVSSFGIGGTNAHVVLEQPPEQEIQACSGKNHLLLLSARSPQALAQRRADLCNTCREPSPYALADMAFTLQVGREHYRYRQALICGSMKEARKQLADPAEAGETPEQGLSLVFMFPGRGFPYEETIGELYGEEQPFRRALDRCTKILLERAHFDLRAVLFPAADGPSGQAESENDWEQMQAALFSVSYAYGRLWLSFGLQPDAVIGHDLGEYAAACLAGVFSLEDALTLVVERGRLAKRFGAEGRLLLPLSEAETRRMIGSELRITAIEADDQTMVSGNLRAISALTERVTACRRLPLSYGFPNPLPDEVPASFEAVLGKVAFNKPTVPMISGASGTWADPQRVMTPLYWLEQMGAAVRFSTGIKTLSADGPAAFLELGPGRYLTDLSARHDPERHCLHLASSPSVQKKAAAGYWIRSGFAQLWLAGFGLGRQGLYPGEKRRRVPLPTYPFQRKRYWIDPPETAADDVGRTGEASGLSSKTLPGQTPQLGVVDLGKSEPPRPQAGFSEPNSLPRDGLMQAYKAPGTEVEYAMAVLWERFFALRGIGLEDSFFELGGDSLMASQLLSRVRDQFGSAPGLESFFEAPTIAALCRAQDSATGEERGLYLEPDPVRRAELSFAQERLWVMDRLEGPSATYNMPSALRLEGPIDLKALATSLRDLVARQAVLRTYYPEEEGKPRQRIESDQRSQTSLTVLAVGKSWGRGAVFQAKMLTWIEQNAVQPFHLAERPPFRVMVLRVHANHHVLLINLHHIAGDAWSLDILIREWMARYRAISRGGADRMADLPVQYADFAAWQRRWLASPEGKAQLDFWKEALSGLPALLELAGDRPRPARQSYAGGRIYFTVASSMVRGLERLARDEGATLFMLLAAAFKTLLFRYSGQPDFALGFPIANRNRTEWEPLIGVFVNTLVLRCQPRRDQSFRAFLDHVRRRALAAYDHQDVPFEKVVEVMALERNLSHSPLFQTFFELQHHSLQPPSLAGMVMDPIPLTLETAKFDLSASFTPSGDGGLNAYLEFSRALFEPERIERMARHFLVLFEAIGRDSNRLLGDLPLLTEAERELHLHHWNRTEVDLPQRDRSLVSLWERQVSRSPLKTAISFRDDGFQRSWSYAELNHYANRVAHGLRGIGPENGVLLLCERGGPFLGALLGIFKAGGYYIPLDPKHGLQRCEQICAESGARLLLAQDRLSQLAVKGPADRLILENLLETSLLTANPQIRINPDQLAYTIFTSGSTGTPKGAMVHHAGMVNHLGAKLLDLQIGASDKLVQNASQSFDISVWQYLAPLLAGGVVHVVDDQTAADPAALLDEVVLNEVTILELVPSLLRVMLPEINDRGENWLSQMRLRWLVVTGEALPPDLCRDWFSLCEGIPMLNAYGPTECSDDVTHAVLLRSPRQETVAMPIGKAVANIRLYVLDQGLQPQPVGVPGQLFVGGVAVGRGYLNQPEKTAWRFIPNPFPAPLDCEAGAHRLYRSGDLVRRLADGAIAFLGRTDHQVKIRGFRIELGEIEAVLRAFEAVGEAVVVAIQDEKGSSRLVAYVTEADPGREWDLKTLREHLEARLPAYMVPAHLVPMAALPLNANGKVDRRALPDPPKTSVTSPRENTPGSATEVTLLEIWKTVLGLEELSPHDNFFMLGGDSILSIQVTSLAGKAGLVMNPNQLFQHQTVAELARIVVFSTAEPAQKGPLVGSARLLPIQQQFFEQNLPDPHYYNQALLFKIAPEPSQAALRESFEFLAHHHDAFRLRFQKESSGMRQFYQETPGLIFFEEDLTAVSSVELAGFIREKSIQYQRRINFETGPLMVAVLFRLGSEESRLLLAAHHLIMDGVSWRVLLEDLWTVYDLQLQGKTKRLPPKSASFQVWGSRLAEYAGSAGLAATATFWEEQMAGIASLPRDFDGSASQPVILEQQVLVRLNGETTQALIQQMPQIYGTQMQETLLAALASSLHLWTGAARFLIDLEGHGREPLFDDLSHHRTIGWFTSLFPFLLHRKNKVGETLKRVKEDLRRIPDHGIGYGLLRYLHPEISRRWAEYPRPQIIFNYLGQMDQVLSVHGLLQEAPEEPGPIKSARNHSPYLLEINASVTGGRLQTRWLYSDSIFNRETVATLAEGMLSALEELVGEASESDKVFTPSDFPEIDLDQEALDYLIADLD